jgi:hypothetical protein
MEIKNALKHSEQIALNAKTQGHAIKLHHTISDIGLRARALEKGKGVSAFAGKTWMSDQFYALTMLLNSPKGQEALTVLDYLNDNLVETKKGNQITRVSLTGPVPPASQSRFSPNAGSVVKDKVTKMTAVLELKPRGFPGCLYIVTAYPNQPGDRLKVEPTLTQVRQWKDRTDNYVGDSIRRLFK